MQHLQVCKLAIAASQAGRQCNSCLRSLTSPSDSKDFLAAVQLRFCLLDCTCLTSQTTRLQWSLHGSGAGGGLNEASRASVTATAALPG